MFTPYEPGTPAAEGFIALCVPEIRGNEWKYIKECLDTGWVSSVGSFVDRFEKELAEYIGAKYAVATLNGTSALHIALLVAGVDPHDEVLVPALTFIAPANAVRYVGAWPVFIDAEEFHWQMDPEKVAEFLEKKCSWHKGKLYNIVTKRPIKAILPVHILGHPVDMDPIIELARKYDLVVIEDATESLGAKYKNRNVGHLGDIACFSFNGNKIITTGGGGMIVTNNEDWARRSRYLSTQAKDDPIEYIHKEIGYNYRLTNIQGAMGCAQLEQLEYYISAKRRIAADYCVTLGSLPGIEPMKEAPWARSTFWMYTISVEEKKFGLDRKSLLQKLSKCGIQTRPLWQPLHKSPAHKQANFFECSTAEKVQDRALSLPCSVSLLDTEQEKVTKEIRRCCLK